MQRAVLNEQRRNRATAFVEARFNHNTLCGAVGVGFQFLHLCNEQDSLQQLVNILMRLGGNRNADCISTPLFGDELIFRQLLHHALRVGAGAIHLIDCDNNRNIRRFRVVNRFHCLRHDAIIRCNHQNRDICRLRAACAHCSEGRMAGRIQEGDILPVDRYAVCADVLRNAARFALCYRGVANRIQQGGFAVVNVAHHHNNRIAG